MAKQRTARTDAPDPTTDDTLLFRAAVRDVKPLVAVPRGAGPPKPRPRKPLRRPRDAAQALDADMPLLPTSDAADPPARSIAAGDVLTFQRPGVRTQVMRRLRRGLIPIEGELDLHGLGQAAARDQLAQFLAGCRVEGRRCVRVIHGKGYRSGMRGPILKIAVDLWLRRHADVMAFTSARAIDGGTGAVYVLLRA
jgi:DNA-nicking Smr family endonuclease